MIPIFKNVGLIGLGLIGGSLARSIKKNNIAVNITGYAKSSASTKLAFELGIIDNIAKSLSELESCDIIVICTPLSTYKDIFQELATILNIKNTIITDAGSLKACVINIAEKYLNTENLVNFIPAHPIAGTEKTGVESGFAELYEDKRIILTPLKNTSPKALGLVSKLWHLCGAHTQIMDAEKHDKIYAEVSHLPQLLAYCYASLLYKYKGKLKKNNLKNNDHFWRFSRICASDPIIWLDIFSLNKNNILISLEKFTNTINNINNNSTYNNIHQNDNGNALFCIIPALISEALITCSTNSQYAGSGFRDFSSYDADVKTTEEATIMVNEFLSITNSAAQLIQKNDKKKLHDFLEEAVSAYKELKDNNE